MAVNLKQLVDEISMVDEDQDIWYSPSTEEFYEQDDDVPEDAVQLPTKMERDDYGMIRDFAESRTGEERDWLVNAISGRGAFHRFRSVLERFGIEDQWYRWQENAMMDLAMGWCEDNGIPYSLSGADVDPEDAADEEAEEREAPVSSSFNEAAVSWRLVEINRNNYMRLLMLKKDFEGCDVSLAQQELENDLRSFHVYAASLRGQFAGYLEVSEDGKVREVYVDPSMRRKGAGKALLKSASENYGPLVIHLPLQFKDARGFFSACGYGREGYVDLYPDSEETK